MNDGSITFSTELDNSTLEKQLSGLEKKINTINDKIAQKQAQRAPFAAQSAQLAAQLDAEKARLEMMRGSPDTFAANAISDQAARVKALEAEWSAVQSKVERYDQQISEATIELERNQANAGMVSRQLSKANGASVAMGQAVAKAGKKLDTFRIRLASVVRSALIFVVITQALAKLREWIGNVIKATPEATAAIASLKGALLTMAQPIVSVVIPAFIALINIITQVITAIARVTSILFGSSMSDSAKSAKSLNDQTDALNGVGGAAKDAGKQLASFDEINQLSDNSSNGGGGGTGANGIKPDFSAFNTDEYKAKIDALTTYVSGALLMLGALLTFSGANIPLGLALMAAGAVGLVAEVKENWGESDGKVRTAINNTLLILSAAGLVIGAILAFSGVDIPLGIALMAAGAASLVTVTSLNWDSIKAALQGPIGKTVAIVSTALLAIGAILAFTGVALPLGIALMAAGAAGLATTTVLNWDSIKEALQGPIGRTVAYVSGALLVLGIILCATGVAIPLGIALIAAGAAGLATVAAVNWDAILNKIKEIWKGVADWWNTNVAPIFTKEWWSDKFNSIKEGLEDRIKAAVNAGIALFNRFIDWINEKMNFTWPSLTIAGKQIIAGGSHQLFTIPHIPQLATGAVIPPNREFLAMLGDQKSGTNIEAPESLIRRIVREESGGRKGPTTIILECDRREFGRLVLDLYDEENQRLGVNFEK